MIEKLNNSSSNENQPSQWDTLRDIPMSGTKPTELPPNFRLPNNPILSEFVTDYYPATPEHIKQKFDKLDFSEFEDFLIRFNNSTRMADNKEFDGNGLLANGYLPPAPEDRAPLLKEIFEYSKTLDSPEKSGFALASSILTIHPFLDGNGRASRTIFALFINGYSGSETDAQLFNELAPAAKDDDYHQSASRIIDLDPTTIELPTASPESWDQNLEYQVTHELREDAIIKRFGAPEADLNLPIRIGVRNRDMNYTPDSELTKTQQSELYNMFESKKIAYISCIKSFPDSLFKSSIEQHDVQGTTFETISYQRAVRSMNSEDFEAFSKTFNQTTIEYVKKIAHFADDPNFNTTIAPSLAKIANWQHREQSMIK